MQNYQKFQYEKFFQFSPTLLSLVQSKNELEIIEFEGQCDPAYLKLEQYPEEKRWEFYAEKVQDIMSKCLGLEKSNSGYREEQDYEIKILRENKKVNSMQLELDQFSR